MLLTWLAVAHLCDKNINSITFRVKIFPSPRGLKDMNTAEDTLKVSHQGTSEENCVYKTAHPHGFTLCSDRVS